MKVLSFIRSGSFSQKEVVDTEVIGRGIRKFCLPYSAHASVVTAPSKCTCN